VRRPIPDTTGRFVRLLRDRRPRRRDLRAKAGPDADGDSVVGIVRGSSRATADAAPGFSQP